jgi:hypothetical protein
LKPIESIQARKKLLMLMMVREQKETAVAEVDVHPSVTKRNATWIRLSRNRESCRTVTERRPQRSDSVQIDKLDLNKWQEGTDDDEQASVVGHFLLKIIIFLFLLLLLLVV